MKTTTLLRIVAVLWIVWGAVHVLAGVLTLNFSLQADMASAIGGIADAVAAQQLEAAYPAALSGILGQHGFNLLWFGLATLLSSLWIWKGNWRAVALAAIIGGLADLGYFLFLDLGGYVHFVPGTVMTLVSGLAILLSLLAYYRTS